MSRNKGKNRNVLPQTPVKRPPYYGAARFIEIAPPSITYRSFANVDHIMSVNFSEVRETVQVPIVDSEETPPETKDRSVVTGHRVSINVGGQNNEFTFTTEEVAIHFYNQMLAGIDMLVPTITTTPMVPKSAPEDERVGLIDANGDELPGDYAPETEH